MEKTTTKEISPVITSRLLNWYAKEGRELPWRETSNPYRIWISEIILQQTRVAQGRDYYTRFIQRFPTVATLAAANEEDVLKVWQGLGYYTRARNLHAAAKQIMTAFNGTFPSTYSVIISLKGIGAYTAAAIASIAFHEPYAVVDGNVLRVISRLFGISLSIHSTEGKKIIGKIAQSLLDTAQPGKYNQAVMDFGALVCTPAQPGCITCVLRDYCTAFSEGRVSELPVNERKISIRHRYFNYFHILHDKYTYLQKRNTKDIWKNLFEFPLIETSEPTDFVELQHTEPFRKLFHGLPTLHIHRKFTTKHQLSHQTIHTTFYTIVLPQEIAYNPPEGIFKIENERLPDYPVARLTHKYLEII